MKTTKPKLVILSLLFLVLNSCNVIISLFPFYTNSTIYFEKKFIGTWVDKENAKWEILPFHDVILKENKKSNVSELSADQFSFYNKYKNGYVVYFEKDSTKSSFLAMPFKINNQLFVDFTPIEDNEFEELKNELYKMHLLGTHTLAKFDFINDNEMAISWIEHLINEDKIKHEEIGFYETALLTASSEELQKFLKKHMDSKDIGKWDTDVKINLKRVNGK